ncbi:AMP-binding protein [Aurantimicrobium minutum]|uniref:AMP-binding protein n=1 Tax=Aurantimicrobium minutum TaxID=708131 RepID=UPI00248ECA0E|nr:AMP-binding protein [Aurantimicrobium minutum]
MVSFNDHFSLIEGVHSFSSQNLVDDRFMLRSLVSYGGKVALIAPEASLVVASLTALEGWASEVQLCPEGALDDDFDGIVLTNPISKFLQSEKYIERDSSIKQNPLNTSWVMYTSGTSGKPKAVRKSLDSLVRSHRSDDANGQKIWGLIYEPIRMAGIQVITHCLIGGHVLVATNTSETLSEKIKQFVTQKVDSLSATPTLWRQIMQTPEAQDLSLSQITLGGEIADQKTLNALKKFFPDARISHVYASTEVGVGFAVHDQLEGFPLSFLEDVNRNPQLRVNGEILEVGIASDNDLIRWESTGDCVKIEADRVKFLGRESGLINIGGAKVWPEDVERILRQHPLVIDAVVKAKPSSFSGNILVAEVKISTNEPEDLSKQLRKWVRSHAASYYVPASISINNEMTVSSTGKVKR